MDCIVHGSQRVRHDWATFTSVHFTIAVFPRMDLLSALKLHFSVVGFFFFPSPPPANSTHDKKMLVFPQGKFWLLIWPEALPPWWFRMSSFKPMSLILLLLLLLLFSYLLHSLPIPTQFSVLLGQFILLFIVMERLEYRPGENQQGGFMATLGIEGFVSFKLLSSPRKKQLTK